MFLFSLVIAAWMLCVALGIVLLFVRRLRNVGVYAITVSTSALLVSLAISTVVLFTSPVLMHRGDLSRSITAFKFAYAGSILAGGIVGGLAGGFGMRRLLASKKPA